MSVMFITAQGLTSRLLLPAGVFGGGVWLDFDYRTVVYYVLTVRKLS